MKIIGTAGHREFVCTLSEQEIYNLIGFSGPYDAQQKGVRSIEPGMTITVSEIYRTVLLIRGVGASVEHQARAAIAALTSVSDAARTISNSVTPPPEPEKT